METKEKLARFFISRVDGLGTAKFREILFKYNNVHLFLKKNPEEIIDLLGEKVGRNLLSARETCDINSELSFLKSRNIGFVVYGEEDYPSPLNNTSDFPIVIYHCGDYQSKDFPKSIAVVGTRKISSYGKQMTKKLVEGLVNAGFTIVSGMAFGVDREAHLAAINNGGRTIAVLASSPDDPSPRSNAEVHKKIINNGCVISELFPGEKIVPGLFPKRNRVIASISLATLIVEADVDSGALITANIAFSEGRQIFAVPGNVGQQSSKGTNLIIKQGKAKLIEDVQDILTEFGYSIKSTPVMSEYKPKSDIELKILDIIRLEGMTMEKLSRAINYDIGKLGATMAMLEIENVIEKGEDDIYRIVLSC